MPFVAVLGELVSLSSLFSAPGDFYLFAFPANPADSRRLAAGCQWSRLSSGWSWALGAPGLFPTAVQVLSGLGVSRCACALNPRAPDARAEKLQLAGFERARAIQAARPAMGCSSSALHKAGDSSSRLRGGVPANECVSTAEESESCVAQPKPCTLGRESAFYGKVQSKSLPPLERPRASVAPTANGVTSRHELSLVEDGAAEKDATEQIGPTEKTGPTDSPEESELPQPGDKDDTAETEEMKRDLEAATEVQPSKGNAETEPPGMEAKSQRLRPAGESDSPTAGESAENPPNAGLIKPPGRAENSLPPESAGDLQPGEAMENVKHPQMPEASSEENKSPEISEECQSMEIVEQQRLQETLGQYEQSQLLEAIPSETKSPESLEESQLVENSEEQQRQGTLGKDEQSQLPETIAKEDATPEISDRSHLVQTPAEKDSLHKIPEAPGNMEQIESEDIAGSREYPAGAAETAANVEMARKSHSDEEEQHIEGETGEKVEADTENEKASEGAETKEQETGEAMDLSADGDGDQRVNGHSVLH